MAGLPRPEQVLLRWADHDGKAVRRVLPHHGADPGDQWVVLYV